MASVISRTNPCDYRTSVNTPDYSVVDWIINPDVSDLTGVPCRYWKIVGDLVLEMTPEEKAVVDAVIPPAQPASLEVLYAENLLESGTTSTSYQDKVELEFALIAAKTCMIFWFCEIKPTLYSRGVKVQICVDEIAQPANIDAFHIESWHHYSGFVRVVLNSGSHEIELKWASTQSGKTASIRNARLMAFEVENG